VQFQEAPSSVQKRRMRTGHTLSKPEQVAGLPGFFAIRCTKECGWFTLGLWDDKERHEYLAWLHRTEPMLLVAGSSDNSLAMRQASLEDIAHYGKGRPST
jgi:hypothetical protein